MSRSRYREVRVVEAHKTLARRSPVLTIIGPARLTLATLGLVLLVIVVRWAGSVDWTSLALWVIPGMGLVALLVWATLWWTGRT